MAGRRIGYLKLKSFTARTQPDVAAAVKHLQVSLLKDVMHSPYWLRLVEPFDFLGS
jgi:hypothetical protein